MRACDPKGDATFQGAPQAPPASRRTFHVAPVGLLPNVSRQARAAASIHALSGPQRHDPTCRRVPPSPPGRGSRPARQGGTRRGPAPRRRARRRGAGPIRRGPEAARPRPEPSGMPPRFRSNPARGDAARPRPERSQHAATEPARPVEGRRRRGLALSIPGTPPRSRFDLARAGCGAAPPRALRAASTAQVRPVAGAEPGAAALRAVQVCRHAKGLAWPHGAGRCALCPKGRRDLLMASQAHASGLQDSPRHRLRAARQRHRRGGAEVCEPPDDRAALDRRHRPSWRPPTSGVVTTFSAVARGACEHALRR